MHLGDSVAELGSDERAQGLVQLVFLALLKQSGPKDRLLLDVNLPSMRAYLRGAPNRLLVPATTVLEYCKLAVDPASANDYSRLYSFVLPVCQIIDDPPIAFHGNPDPNSPAVQKDLKLFSDWFKTNRPYWEAAAKAEAPELERLRTESDEAARSLEPTTAR